MIWSVISMDPSLHNLKIPNDGLIQKGIFL